MSMLPQTRELLRFLDDNPGVRSRIAAAPNATLLYAGEFFRDMWKEVEQLKRSNRDVASKQLLADVLARIQTPGTGHHNLLEWASSLDVLVPTRDNAFVAWCRLSGIFAANARGTVSFCVGSKLTVGKVFLAAELPALLQNPNVDDITRDVLAYFQRCVESGQIRSINFTFIGG